ncbi:MAG: hypothetical protein HOI22_13985 [Tateyamaria sp.]|jgi:protocatechuate 3,4-dioxygenase beta subunit|nr:hypothetical protein [Tateyamaria sp.]
MIYPASNLLPATNEDTCGPYFPIYFADPALENLTRLDPGLVTEASGMRIILRGRVLDRHGELANGVVLEFWQANAKGVYRTPATEGHEDIDTWFYGYGRMRTATGAYELPTIMPGAATGRAPNITVTIFSDGINRVVTQVFFDTEDGNESDPVLQAAGEEAPRLIARHDGRTASGAEVYVFDIIMAGDNETPFFDDLES